MTVPLNIEDIADADYPHAKGVCKDENIIICMFKEIHYC